MEDEESLETSALVRKFSDAVKDQVNQFFAYNKPENKFKNIIMN